MKNNKEVKNSLKLLARTSMFVFIAVVLSKILTYVYRIVIARSFGPEVYGLFILAIMIMGLFVTLSSFGLSEGVLRFIPYYRGKKDLKKIQYLVGIVSVALFFSSILSGVILFVLSEFIAVKFFHNEGLIIFLKVFSFFIPISLASNLYLAIIRAYEKIAVYAFIANVLQNVIKLITLLIMVFFGFVVMSIITSYVVSLFLMLIIAFIYVRYKLPNIHAKPNLDKKTKKSLMNELFIYSWPIMFLGLIQTFFYQTDSFFIGFFKDVSQVGLYNAAIPIVSLLGIASELFMQLFFPLITREFSKKEFNTIKELSQQVGKWILLLNIPIFLIIFIFPETIINILFGAGFLEAAPALRILSIGGLLSSLIVLLNSLILMSGKSRLMLINLISVFSLNILLNIFLIPKYGLVGAAISTIVSWGLLSVILFFEVYKILSIIPIKKGVFKIILIGFFLFLILVALKSLVVLNIVSFFLLLIFLSLSYLFLLLVTNSFDENDWFIIKGLKNKIHSFSTKK